MYLGVRVCVCIRLCVKMDIYTKDPAKTFAVVRGSLDENEKLLKTLSKGIEEMNDHNKNIQYKHLKKMVCSIESNIEKIVDEYEKINDASKTQQ